MISKNKKNQEESFVTLDGLMTIGECENGLHTMDFACCEDVRVEPFTAKCKVQAMRDGNVYMTELPPRVRRKAQMKLAHSSVSYGADGYDRFVFVLPSEQRWNFCRLLRDEANEAALYVATDILGV
ncbi:MAG: hypothetical protein K5945_01245 [Bacteroidaceae bacterium]|nr:hypothetical protein [Bacteroidaceae bacterium]